MVASASVYGRKTKNTPSGVSYQGISLDPILPFLTPRLTKYIPHRPTPQQAAFLLCNDTMEVLYGGAAGGGKSDGLLMAALQFVDVPGYAAIILRRTYADLSLPGAIMDRAEQWLMGSDAKWDAKRKTWVFPSSATLSFGYLQHESDKYRYQSSEFQFIGFDELTQFHASQYLFMHSRLRRPRDFPVPVRMRSGTNPGNIGHQFVKEAFITNPGSRVFIPAKLSDNPYIDQESYIEGLNRLDVVTRKQLLEGDWNVSLDGTVFNPSWVDVQPHPGTIPGMRTVRYWDIAATEPHANNLDPDYCVGALLGLTAEGMVWLLNVQRFRATPAKVEARIMSTAETDGQHVPVWVEQEGGSSGKMVVDHYKRLLTGWSVFGDRPVSDKRTRAMPLSSLMQQGRFIAVNSQTWTTNFLEELALFPYGMHDDQVDAVSGALKVLTTKQVTSRIAGGV